MVKMEPSRYGELMQDQDRRAPEVYVVHLKPFEGMLEALGHSRSQALSSCGLPADLFQQPDTASAPLSAYFRLCEFISVRAGDETLRVSQRPLLVGASDLVQARLRECGTIEQAMDAVATVFNILHGNRYNSVQRRGGQIAYIIDDRGFPYTQGYDAQFVLFTLECLLVLLHVLLTSIAEVDLVPLAIRTRRPAAQAHQPHLDFLGAPIRYGSESYGIVYPVASASAHVNPTHSAILSARTVYGGVARALEHLIPIAPNVSSVSTQVLLRMEQGDPGQEEIAHALGLSVATLRRRLSDEGTSFRELRAANLNKTACQWLALGRAPADIADDLGFSDLRSFVRAFQSWNQLTPREYQRRQGL